jgi:hypothetical protein
MVLMKTLSGLSVVLILSSGLFAQNRSGFVNTGQIVRSFPSVIYPGGTSALPGVQRTVGSVLYPGGGTQIGVPGVPYKQPNVFSRQGNGFGGNGFGGNGFGSGNGFFGGRNKGGVVNSYAVPVAVPVPVYVGNGYDDPSAYGAAYGAGSQVAPGAPAQAAPNVIIIYPQGAAAPYGPTAPPSMIMPQPQPAEAMATPADTGETATHYFIALKDHSIYSAVAYWVDGDTLHYFTTGSTHNEVSLSLVDRDLTKRLNEGSGLQLSLPPAK